MGDINKRILVHVAAVALCCTLLLTPLVQHPAAAATVAINNVPYIHQVYDTPDWFNGNWACGATSAMMALAYYGILPYWDCTVSVPYPHVSHWGRYICEIYTFNGHTYDIGSVDPSGNTGYGGYGYITQNNWEDTKGHMAEYATYHGLGSGVDWSPAWGELTAEIDSGHPVVLLTSLTSAGHYVLAVGYYTNQYSVVINDPYGNKNQGYMNYNGAYVTYDWPGYDYGNSNLNTLHCFIYMRHAPPAPTLDSAYNAQSFSAVMEAGSQYTVWVEYKNTGTATWTPGGSNPVRLGT